MKSDKVVVGYFLIFLYTSLSLRLNFGWKIKNLREFLNYVFVGKTRTNEELDCLKYQILKIII